MKGVKGMTAVRGPTNKTPFLSPCLSPSLLPSLQSFSSISFPSHPPLSHFFPSIPFLPLLLSTFPTLLSFPIRPSSTWVFLRRLEGKKKTETHQSNNFVLAGSRTIIDTNAPDLLQHIERAQDLTVIVLLRRGDYVYPIPFVTFHFAKKFYFLEVKPDEFYIPIFVIFQKWPMGLAIIFMACLMF